MISRLGVLDVQRALRVRKVGGSIPGKRSCQRLKKWTPVASLVNHHHLGLEQDWLARR